MKIQSFIRDILEFLSTRQKISVELLDFIKLNDKAGAKVGHLSGGMKRRFVIARTLLHRPKILLLDEPTTGLDQNVRQEIWDKMEELRESENLTIVLSTHYMDEAEKLSHRLLVLARGKVIVKASPRQIIQDEVKKFVLEIRQAERSECYPTSEFIISRRRGSTQLYFAYSAERLMSLMRLYGTRAMVSAPRKSRGRFSPNFGRLK